MLNPVMFRFSLKVRFHGVAAAVLTVALAAAWLHSPATARAAAYPSWDEVHQAKGDVEAKAAQIAGVEALLDGLQRQAGELGNAAVAAAAGYTEAEAELAFSDRKIDILAAHRAQAEEQAAQHRRQAGELAAQTYKTGATNQTLLVLLEPGAAEETLQGLDLVQMVAERTSRLYEDARAAERVSAGLVAQEEEARAERDRLAARAQTSWAEAEQTSRAAQDKVAEQQARSAVLLEQLAELKDTSAQAEEERRRGLAAEESYKAQQEAAAAAAEVAASQAPPAAVPVAPPAAVPLPTAGPAVARAGAGSRDDAPVPAEQPRPAPPAPDPEPAPVASAQPSGPPSPSPGPQPPEPKPQVTAVNDPAGAQAYASGRLESFGWGQDQFQCLVNLWNRESNWRTNALNSSNGAYGIPQSLPGDKMAAAGADWRTNYRTQVDWGLGYIKGRYGSPCGAWGHSERNGWY